MKTKSIVLQKSELFALDIIACYKQMKDQKEFILSKQLLRSGTSIGANINEAQAVISRKDFISKMSIASKEARETRYWLELCTKSRIVDYDYTPLISGIDQLIRMLTSIVKTSQLNT
jgi:four helix bundle protein